MRKQMVALLAGAMLMMATSAMALPLPWLDYSGSIDVVTPLNGSLTTITQDIAARNGKYLDGTSFGNDSIIGNSIVFGSSSTYSVATTALNAGLSLLPNIPDTTFNIKNDAGTANLFSAELINIVYAPVTTDSGTVNSLWSANLKNVTINNPTGSEYSRWLSEIASTLQAPDFLASTRITIDFTGSLTDSWNGSVNVGGKIAPVPEPGTMMLLGLGMFGMAVYGKRRMNKEA